MSKVIGIDISKETFDASWKENGKFRAVVYPNNKKGFEQFSKHLEGDDYCVMEASGPYYLCLAMFLHNRQIKTSVANPLSVKRFSQMQLSRTKTDKKDAAMIAMYGEMVQPALWEPEATHIMEMKDILTALESYEKQITMISNQLEAEKHLPVVSKLAKKSREKMIKMLEKEIDQLTKSLKAIATKHCSETMEKLQT
ncbi:MAG: transposase, partial [Bacteroidetes bacterium]|nr:transposase [Bacteroidota bacterium]